MNQPTDADDSWLLPPADVSPRPGEVHVWRAFLDQKLPHLPRLFGLLSADERERAGRFRSETDRQRFVVRRAALRIILGRCQGFEPRRLRFEYGPHGKPSLAEEFGGDALGFSVSHSRGAAVYAVARGRRVGVDVERVRPLPDAGQVARRFFSPGEAAALGAVAPDERLEAFYNCWTRKEAFVKACGEGLSRPLDTFDVTLAPREAARLLSVEGDARNAAPWSMRSLTPAPGYRAALVVEGHDWRLACWRWTG
ncbi:MAG TPA: 4'-phosphopantetheinyl transferase superfamily protein [Pyrinomonadaceae bacterium]|nr:4'-phosphopantetheinyl transferase superfamily protein [Pyrinomonadaceae bacterium]